MYYIYSLMYDTIKVKPPVLALDAVGGEACSCERVDTVYPLFESDTLFLECCVVLSFGCLAILRIEGCLNSTL